MLLIVKNTFVSCVDVDAESPKLTRSRSDDSLHLRSLCEMGATHRSPQMYSSNTHDSSTINWVCDSVKMNLMQDVETQPFKSPCQGSLKTLGLSKIDAGVVADRMTPMPLDDEIQPYGSPSKDSLSADSDSTMSTVGDYDKKTSMPDDEEQHGEPANEVGFEGTWSVGAELHHIGECRACAWNCNPSGCKNGASCAFCHLCAPGALKQKRKQTERYRKLEGNARRGNKTWLMQRVPNPERGLMVSTAGRRPCMSVSGLALWQLAVTQVNQEQGYAAQNGYKAEGSSSPVGASAIYWVY